MPLGRSSPPPRMSRSPTPASPKWEAESPMGSRKGASSKSPSPRASVAIPLPMPMPPMPSSPLLAPSPRRSSLSPSTSSLSLSPSGRDRSSSGSSVSSQRVSTPPPRHRSRTSSKLLPALPLSIDTTLTPKQKSRRGPIILDNSSSEDVRIIVSQDEHCGSPGTRQSRTSSTGPNASPRARSSHHTPPRPARRVAADPADLLPPQPSFRASSPSGSSISTITGGDLTPKLIPPPDRVESAPPPSAISLISAASTITSTPMGRKRDSSQRRLSALRGLVANLDFNQHWSISERTDSAEGEVFWACGEPIVEESSPEHPPLQVSMPIATPSSPVARQSFTSPVRGVSQDHGWPSSTPPTPPPKNPKLSPSPSLSQVTPLSDSASVARRPRSTPPRRPKLLDRGSSELLSRTPDPPRASRQRMETYGVASSGYNKSLEAPLSPGVSASPTATWRSSLSSDDVYHRVMGLHGKLEVKRQEVMWEMCETEQAFVKSMRTVLRLFAIPLKTPQGKWIDGIPQKITELFDSLECVAHAHGIIAAAQRDLRRRTEVLDTASFTMMFKAWVDRLEVHEAYLVSFEPVVQLVEENVRDPQSVFGEFVRMQMKDEVLGSMGLGSMLLKPVQRLTKYPLFLKRLLDVTPHPHASQPELLSLLTVTESIILRLQATKAREEDYQMLCTLESRLCGLPDDFVLAVRGRKLIGYGQVSRVVPGKDLSPSLSVRARAGSIHSSRGSISSASSGAHSSASSSPWDFTVLSPSTCRTSAFSVSSASSGYPPSRSNSFTQSSPSRPGVTRSPSSSSSVSSEHRPNTPSKSRRKDEALTMFIFDDLVLVATTIHDKGGLFTKKKGDKANLRVLSEAEGGIGKVLEVRDWCGWQGHSTLFALTTVPLSCTAQSPLAGGPVTTAYTLPPANSSRRGSFTHLTCPVLSTIPQYLTTLAQATSAATSMLFSEYRTDESQSGLESIGECTEWQSGPMGFAQ